MRFLSIDQHVSVIADIRYIFNQLGHQVDERSISGHAPVIGRPSSRFPMLDNEKWRDVISRHQEEMFYNIYKDEFSQYDGFICCYPPIFAMLYKYFQKPIIIQIPIRYDCGVESNPVLWEEFNEYLRKGIDNGMIYINANSQYDQEYTEGFLNRNVRYIPSLCQYTGMSYNPVRDKFLYFGSYRLSNNNPSLIYKHDAMRAGHAWQNIADYKGCIHFPYNISTMSTFEQYTANIPLFFPTKRYLLELFLANKPVLHQISWQQTMQTGRSSSPIKHTFEYDPNNFADINSISHWLDLADFYCTNEMKYIQYFDSEKEMYDLLNLSIEDLLEISNKMRYHNKVRERYYYDQWTHVLNQIERKGK